MYITEKKITGFISFYLFLNLAAFSQVDSIYVYNTKTSFGTLDIRIAKSPTDYFYLQEDKTFSFRESAPGVKTDTYLDMTSWDSSPYKQGNLREKKDFVDNFIMNYRLLIPQGYDPAFKEGYPIVMVLHGLGERGNCQGEVCYHADQNYSPIANIPAAPTSPEDPLLNNDHNLLHGAREHLAAWTQAGRKLPNDPTLDNRAFPGFVLFPQNLNGWDNLSSQDAIRILRLVIKKYNINEDRVYIEGISNGGKGMYECLKRAPWLFATAIGMSPINDGFINAQGMASKVAHIPLWIFQGGLDITPYPGTTRRYIQQFRSAGASVRYTFYPQLGHSTWNKAYSEPDFFSWMLGKSKSDIHSFESSTAICSEEGTRLELAEGFMAYQWQLNGQIIPGADQAVFYAKTPGDYRARFSRVSNPAEAQWNPWSKPISLTVAEPPQATITQTGTVLLRDLNGFTDARLKVQENHDHYYWYKDGVLLDLPGDEDDTLQAVTIKPTYGQGAYTLVVSDVGCTSVPSAPKYIFFNDQAPINMIGPTNFAGYSTLPSENTFTWTDVSNDEGGFEIWKRKKISDTFSPWEMAGITDPNVTTFDDKGVEPTATYQYKIRAVSNTGRSEYIPGDANTGLEVETLLDTEAPAAPSEISVVSRGIQKAFFSWKPATDNTRIKEYYVYYNEDSVATGSSDTTFLLTNLLLNKYYEVRVKAVDLSRNFSPPSNSKEISTYFSGLYYQHTNGLWTDLDSIDWSWAEATGIVREFTLSPKTQDDYFNFSFDGYLLLENGGAYQFRTTSDDGSRLWLNNNLLMDNDGVHELTAMTSAATTLEKGPQRIYVQFFDYNKSDSLVVEYKGADTGNQWAKVSRRVLKSDESIITAIDSDPDNGPGNSFKVSVYPNPTTQENIHLTVETVLPAPVQVRLIDLVGRNLFESIFHPGEAPGGINISIPGIISTGVYMLVITQGNTRVREKVLVKR